MWTLILVATLTGDSVHIDHIDGFKTESMCKAAIVAMKESPKPTFLRISGTCVRLEKLKTL